MSGEDGNRVTGIDANWTHGSVGTYRQGCRCTRCVAAHTAARHDYNTRKAGGQIHSPATPRPDPELCPNCFTHHRGECL